MVQGGEFSRLYCGKAGRYSPRYIGQKTTAAAANGIHAKSLRESGERGRNRTFNLLIKSQLLCQLSYAPTAILLNNLPHGSGDPIDFLPVVLHVGINHLADAPSRTVLRRSTPSPQESLHV